MDYYSYYNLPNSHYAMHVPLRICPRTKIEIIVYKDFQITVAALTFFDF